MLKEMYLLRVFGAGKMQIFISIIEYIASIYAR